MWKVQLFCDVCHHACVEGQDVRTNDALYTTKLKARGLGWTYVKRVGWVCARCCTTRCPDLGEYAYYLGNIVTAERLELKGLRVRIVGRMESTRTVHAVFIDERAGAWAKHAHWFFDHEFSAEDPNVQDASNSSREGAGAAEAQAAAAG
jgi:hypothetical protein